MLHSWTFFGPQPAAPKPPVLAAMSLNVGRDFQPREKWVPAGDLPGAIGRGHSAHLVGGFQGVAGRSPLHVRGVTSGSVWSLCAGGRKLISAMTDHFLLSVVQTWDLQSGEYHQRTHYGVRKMQIRLEKFYSLPFENGPNMLVCTYFINKYAYSSWHDHSFSFTNGVTCLEKFGGYCVSWLPLI